MQISYENRFKIISKHTILLSTDLTLATEDGEQTDSLQLSEACIKQTE